MVKLALKLAVNAAAIWVAVRFVSGLELVPEDDYAKLAILAVVFGLVNTLVKPIVKFFSFPAMLATLGLFLIVINIAMFGIVVALSGSFDLGLAAPGGFGAIAMGGFIASVVAWVGELVVPND